MCKLRSRFIGFIILGITSVSLDSEAADLLQELQASAVKNGRTDWGFWGTDPQKYSTWTSHSNRLIPVYTFGASLGDWKDGGSPYRSEAKLRKLYGRVPDGTLNPTAQYFDQTNVYDLQLQLAKAGKKQIFLIVFDGMDWQTTWAAATYRLGRVAYREGRGTGLLFQDYRGAETDFGYCVTSPHNDGTNVDVDAQIVKNPGGKILGGYDPARAGTTPWGPPPDPMYLIAKNLERKQAYTDSSSSASSLTAGIKTYNNAVNVDYEGMPVATIAHRLQEQGWSIGVVTSVPISHATPAAAYSQNVHRDDYQDLTRDLLGLRSVSHKTQPLPGVDVLIGGGWGESLEKDGKQGINYVSGNRYLAEADLEQVDASRGSGKYHVVQRAAGQNGRDQLRRAAAEAAAHGRRLFGYFGAKGGHLPFRTADGNYDPTTNQGGKTETYLPADILENPSLADMTRAALQVLEKNSTGFWMMVESGDVDWANHANNLDNSIGAVISGDDAFRAVVDWVESRESGWKDAAVILTADHGHYLMLQRPEALASPAKPML